MIPTFKQRAVPSAIVERLGGSGIPVPLARLLAARGVRNANDISGTLKDLLPLQSLLNVDLAAVILADALQAGSKIVVSCDFDVDGCSAGAITLRAMTMMGCKNIAFAMPDRARHSYGLSPLLVQEIYAEHAPDLILTVDCGITSHAGIDEAKKLGIEVLVTDHHLPAETLPDALCIVNPNQRACKFSSKSLSGAGVVFYVMLALRAELRKQGYFEANSLEYPNLSELLDIVALATVADVVALDRNNRLLVKHGLMRIRSGEACAGVNALLKVAGRTATKANVFDLGFAVGPRLNAAGRLDDMSLGLRCLTTDDPELADLLAEALDGINRERREIEEEMKEGAEVVMADIDVAERYSLVLHDETWHPGVIGILASRLKDKHNRPTIIFANAHDGLLKASGRSIPGLHLRDALEEVSTKHPGLLPTFGGHAMAAGLTCPTERFGEFVEAFETVVRKHLTVDDLNMVIEHDGGLLNDEMSLPFASVLENAVWGQGFPAPLFVDEFEVLEQRILKEKHLKLKLQKDGNVFDGIWFFNTESLGVTARLAYSLSVNEFNGAKKVQVMVKHAVVQ